MVAHLPVSSYAACLDYLEFIHIILAAICFHSLLLCPYFHFYILGMQQTTAQSRCGEGLTLFQQCDETKQAVRLSCTSWCELSWCDYSLMAGNMIWSSRCWQNNVRCVAKQCSGFVYAPVCNLGRLALIYWFISGALWTLRQRLSMDRRNLLQWAWAMFEIHGLHVVYWIASDFMCFAL